jgi:hypothetical protein
LIHFVETFPGEADRRPAVFDIEPGLQRSQGDFAPSVVGDRDRRWSAEVEIIAIPDIGLDNRQRPMSLLFAGGSCRFGQELGQPRQVAGGGREGERPSDAVAPWELGLLLASDRLDPAKASSIRLRMRWLMA